LPEGGSVTSGKQRVDGAPAFLLQAHPYRETSLVVDVFSRDHGRIGLVARGAKRPRAALRGVLVEFQPLELGWFGAGELRTLARAEWQRAWPMLAGPRLLLGYYLNELLQRLLAREDAHPALFDLYSDTLQKLALAPTDTMQHEVLLRRFEKALLRELGYGLTLDFDAHGEVIDAGAATCIDRIRACCRATPAGRMTLVLPAPRRWPSRRTITATRRSPDWQNH
jgi:DNA repair protein RecO (recombination protein O)